MTTSTPEVWAWGTVTANAPLRVRVDGESTPANVTPTSLVGGLSVGDRVRLQIVGRRMTVFGKATAAVGWLSYVPVLTATTTNPTLGNSTLIGRYRWDGGTVQLRVELQVGSSFVPGDGRYSLTLPVPAAASTRQVIGAHVTRQTAGTEHLADARIEGGANIERMTWIRADGTPADITGTNPAWAATDRLFITGMYEAAV